MDFSSTMTTIGDWFKNLWNKLEFEGLGDSSSIAIQVAIYFVSGFAIGFLFKKYLKFVLACLILSIVLIKVLEYNKVLDMDWDALKTLLGFDPAADWNVVFDFCLAWVKTQMLIVISSIVGFFIGYKLG